MTVKYLDPYKDDPYGKLRGDKTDTWFKISFSEAKLYAIDNGYILAGQFTQYSGVIRNFKANEPLFPGLCAIPIYNDEYDVWEKGDDGKSKAVKHQPSKFEVALCEIIKNSELDYLADGKSITGEISFSPDAQVSSMRESDLPQFVLSNASISSIASTDALPSYTPPTTSSFKKTTAKSYGLSPDDKLAFVKRELCHSIAADWGLETNSLGLLINQMIIEHKDDETFLAAYFDTLRAVIS